MPNREWYNMVRRYDGLPDEYYGGPAPQGPIDFNSAFSIGRLRPSDGGPAEPWEIMAGSGRLPATARAQGNTHLPPPN